MVTAAHQVGIADFYALPDDGNRYEWVRGEVRSMPPPKGWHGPVEVAILAAIDRYLEEKATTLGWDAEQDLDSRYRLVGFAGGGEFGMQFSLPDDPLQIRGADGVFVPAEQYQHLAWTGETYFPGVPRLVFEVISPSETATDVAEKVQDYLAGGALHVWCVYPERRTIHIHAANAPTQVLRWGDSLKDEELLPGFALPLKRIFLPPSRAAHAERQP